jgi:PiT family inorganic phosphate transporter
MLHLAERRGVLQMASLLLLLLAGVASFFMAWSIGAGSSGSTPFAPAVGANAISIMRAGFFVGVLGLAGAVLQGANVTEAVGRELIRGVSISPLGATVALLVAGGLVAVGVFAGYPVATAFTVTGAMVGVGLAQGGDPALSKYAQIGTLWVLTPFAGGGAAFGIARLLRHESVPERVGVPLLGGVVGLLLANIEFTLLGPEGAGASLAVVAARRVTGGSTGAAASALPVAPGTIEVAAMAATSLLLAGVVAAALYRDVATSPEAAQQRFLLAMGALVAFSAGGSQVGLAIGPVVPLLDDLPLAVPLVAVLFAGGAGLLVGSWTGAPRMIKALSQDYSSLGPRRSIAALIPSFAIAQTAVLFGIPVSFNEIVVSAIVGSGYAAGGSSVSGAKMGYTVLAWVGSLVLAFVLGYGVYAGVAALVS